MALCRVGQGITDIRGKVGGVYFHRDRSGLHVARRPRVIRRRSPDQDKQRKAFVKARTFCKIENSPDRGKKWLNRCVSFNIYRALNDVELKTPPVDYQIPTL